MSALYIVPTDLLRATPPSGEWHATTFPSDQTRSLVVVAWPDPAARIAFELQLEVVNLGEPWETLSIDAASLIGSLEQSATETTVSTATPSTPIAQPDPVSVASALRTLSGSWPGVLLNP